MFNDFNVLNPVEFESKEGGHEEFSEFIDRPCDDEFINTFSTAPSKAKTNSKHNGLPPTTPTISVKWTTEEDAALKNAVETNGAKNWKNVRLMLIFSFL